MKFIRGLDAWRFSRNPATVKRVSQMTGCFMRVSFAIRQSKCRERRLWMEARILSKRIGDRFREEFS